MLTKGLGGLELVGIQPMSHEAVIRLIEILALPCDFTPGVSHLAAQSQLEPIIFALQDAGETRRQVDGVLALLESFTDNGTPVHQDNNAPCAPGQSDQNEKTAGQEKTCLEASESHRISPRFSPLAATLDAGGRKPPVANRCR